MCPCFCWWHHAGSTNASGLYRPALLSPRCMYNMCFQGGGLRVQSRWQKAVLGFSAKSLIPSGRNSGRQLQSLSPLLCLKVYWKKPHIDATAKCTQRLPESPVPMLAGCHVGLFKLLTRSDNAQFKISHEQAFDAKSKTPVLFERKQSSCFKLQG